jgi:putative transposase
MDPLADLPEHVRKLVLERFRLIQPHLEGSQSLLSVAKNAGIAYRTAQRWVSRYRVFGLVALARKKRRDRGARRVVSAKVRAFIEGLALQKPSSLTALYRQALRFARERGEKPPSYGTVFSIVRRLPADPVTLAGNRTNRHSATLGMFHRREATGPNAIWQADQTPLDICVIRPGGKPARPCLTVVMDDYSRAVAGYFLSFKDPSSVHTSLALRQAIWCKEDSRWMVRGIPDVLYAGYESDFTSRYLEQAAAELNIRLVFSLPGEPRSRCRLEQLFLTVNQWFLCELDGYVPPGCAMRGKATLTLAEFDARLRSFFLDVYHRRERDETNMPPAARWQAAGFAPRMPSSLEQLDLLLMRVAKERRVWVDGVHFHSLRYISPTLAAYVGESVHLRFDPREMAEIRVFRGDQFLCRAVCAERLSSNNCPTAP